MGGFSGLPRPGTDLIPGANPGGAQTSVASPAVPAGQTPAIGGNTNPLVPAPPVGQSIFPANFNPAAGATAGQPLQGIKGLVGGAVGTGENLARGLRDAGVPTNIADSLAKFLQSGAGYNPQVAEALIAAMQPGIQRGEADIMEQFSNMGLRGGSPAAIAMGDYLSQVQLNEGQIFAQLYEQSVQNYLDVLLGQKSTDQGAMGIFKNIQAGISTAGSLFNLGFGSSGISDVAGGPSA